jgi:DNA-binding protein Fis
MGTGASNPAPGPIGVEALNELKSFVRQLLAAKEPEIYREIVNAVDRVVIAEVLSHVEGNQVRASELLGISRTTLRNKLELQVPDESNRHA